MDPKFSMNIQCLDKGFLEYEDHMGTDMTILNAARVSFNKRKSGELDEKDTLLMNYLAEHEHWCYDGKTEVFTNKGWVFWPDITLEHKLAAITEDDKIIYETPSKLNITPYFGEMVRIEHAHVDLLITPNHNMWVSRRTNNGFHDYGFMKASDTFDKAYRVKTTALDENGIDGTYNEGYLYGFYLGDGWRASTNTIAFHLIKERKITALSKYLNALNCDWKLTHDKDFTTSGKVVIRVTNSDKHFKGSANNKSIIEETFSKSLNYRKGVWDGLMDSDGSVKRSTYTYSTTSLQLIYDIVRLGTTLGKNVRLGKQQKHKYVCNIISRSSEPRLNDDGHRHNTMAQTAGIIYCAEVSTNRLLVRRNGKQVICGNSPFRHNHLTLRIKAPIFCFRQIMKHRIASEFNEMSGRYTEFKEDEFFLPDNLRKQAKVNKQGSDGIVEEGDAALLVFTVACEESVHKYKQLIELGVCREQARSVLPQGMYSEAFWTISLQSAVHFIRLRTSPHAQAETREYGEAMKKICMAVWPLATTALMEHLPEVK